MDQPILIKCNCSPVRGAHASFCPLNPRNQHEPCDNCGKMIRRYYEGGVGSPSHIHVKTDEVGCRDGDPNHYATPREKQFVGIQRAVMYGTRCIAIACSSTMAKRIARSLNLHAPDPRGI